MGKIAQDFIAESELLLEEANSNGVSADILMKRKILVEKIAIRCENELLAQDKASIISNQMNINPDYLIALEDLTIPVLMICGLFDPVFSPKAMEIEPFQKRSIELYTSQRKGDFGNKEKLDQVQKFHVLHSYDYFSAKQGALLLKDLAPDGVAVSFGGALSSRRYIKLWNLGDRMIALPEKLPEMYLAVAAIALGYSDGNPRETPIHVLGVGSPILVALLGMLFGKSRAVSIDSTAPFKDAYQSTLYGSRFGFLKMDMYKVAAYALIDNDPYTSNTPFFKNFEQSFPHDWGKMRSELGITSSTRVNDAVELLKGETELVEKHIPFFAKMRSGEDALIQHLRMARAGHNYWILHEICNSIRERRADSEKLHKWLEYQINRYTKIASPKWSKALDVIYREMVISR